METKIISYIEEILEELKIKNIEVSFVNSIGSIVSPETKKFICGQYIPKKKILNISRKFPEGFTLKDIWEIILHELAHAYLFNFRRKEHKIVMTKIQHYYDKYDIDGTHPPVFYHKFEILKRKYPFIKFKHLIYR